MNICRFFFYIFLQYIHYFHIVWIATVNHKITLLHYFTIFFVCHSLIPAFSSNSHMKFISSACVLSSKLDNTIHPIIIQTLSSAFIPFHLSIFRNLSTYYLDYHKRISANALVEFLNIQDMILSFLLAPLLMGLFKYIRLARIYFTCYTSDNIISYANVMNTLKCVYK